MRPDEEAEFAALAERQWRFACRVAWAVLRNAHDAEDAAQEAFVKIWKAKAWKGLRDERAFVARVTWRAAVDRGIAVRAGAPAAGLAAGGDSGGAAALEGIADGAPGPEDAAVAADWERAVHRLIDSLPEELRQPLVLSVEMHSREIAEAMGIAEGTVRTRLMRARQMLREKMAALEVRHYARG